MTLQNLSFCIIKPDVVEQNKHKNIIIDILNSDFEILCLKKTRLTKEQIDRLYEEHKLRDFFKDLSSFMQEDDCVLLVLQKDNCIQNFRDLIGATSPHDSAPGTLRKTYGTSKGRNAVHGSDSEQSAQREISIFFPEIIKMFSVK